MKKQLLIISMLIGIGTAFPVMAEKPSLHGTAIAYHTLEILAPCTAVMLNFTYFPNREHEEDANHPIAKAIASASVLFCLMHLFMQGCRGLYKELKPTVQFYADKIKEQRPLKNRINKHKDV